MEFTHHVKYTVFEWASPFTNSLEPLDHRGWDNTIAVRTNVEKIVTILRHNVNKRSDEVFRAAVMFIVCIFVSCRAPSLSELNGKESASAHNRNPQIRSIPIFESRKSRHRKMAREHEAGKPTWIEENRRE